MVLWNYNETYEGTDPTKRYSIKGLPDGAMFTGDNAQILDPDGDQVITRWGENVGSFSSLGK